MKKKTENISLKYIIIGTIAGALSGFFGAGGGVVLAFALSLINYDNEGVKGAFAETALITASYSLVSAVIYGVKGNMSFMRGFPLMFPALIGGYIGAVFLERIGVKSLKRVFGVVVIIAGSIMIFR